MRESGTRYHYQREIDVDSGMDVVVVGGGMAGVTAAVTSARLGARTTLFESTGCLGGMSTNGLVTAFDGMGDGTKHLIGGLMLEIVESLYESGGLSDGADPDTWRKDLYRPTRFRPEALKSLLDKLCIDAGVDVRFFSTVIDVDADPEEGRVHGLIVNQPGGLVYISPRFVIDGSGHASVLYAAGGKVRVAGRDTPQIMPASLCWLSANYNHQTDTSESIDQALASGTFPGIENAIANGSFPNQDYFAVPSRLGNGIVGFNAGHLYQLDAFSVRALSAALMEGRRIAQTYNQWWRENAPGAENMEIVTSAALMGVRESRASVGEYVMTHADFRNRRQFPDQIGVFNKEVDIHVYNPDVKSLQEHRARRADRSNKDFWMSIGEFYGIPYGSIVPAGWKNMWVPGRAISADVVMHGSVRVQPACAITGQAAGAAAAQCLESGENADDIETGRLIGTLRQLGAFLPQMEVSARFTRS